MNRTIATRAFCSVIGFAALLVAGTASAEYRVTAFGSTKAYAALMAMDVPKAEQAFANSQLSVLDFEEANNLCVTKILAKEYEEAVAVCDSALKKVESAIYESTTTKKQANAAIYSNMAVATALTGDLSTASKYLELSLSYKSDDANALSNYDAIATSLVAQN